MTAAENAPLELLSITIKPPGKERLTASHVQKVMLLNSHSRGSVNIPKATIHRD